MNLTLYGDIQDSRMIEDEWDMMGEEERSVAMELLIQREMASVEKIAGMLGYVRNREAFAQACMLEEKRISTRRKSIEAFNDRLTEAIKSYMILKGKDKIEAGTFQLSLRKNPASVDITDEKSIPAKYQEVKTVLSFPKDAIKAALKAGEEVPGAKLVTDRVSLVIK